MQNAQWASMFDDSAVNGEMLSPGVEGLQVLLEGHGMQVGDGEIGAVFTQKAWEPRRSLSKEDFMELMRALEAMRSDALLQRIAGRVEQREFPYVLPSEMGQEDEQSMARDALEFVLKTEHAELQSFIDKKYADFRAITPTDEEVPEPVRRAKFMYSSYYALVVQYNVHRSYGDRKLRHRFTDGVFVPVIPVASLGDVAKKDAAGQASSQMTAALVEALDAKVWDGWDALTKYVPPTEQLFEQYMSGEYFAVMTDVVSAPPPESISVFTPLYPVETGNASPAVQAERSGVVANAVQEDHAEVERILAASWEEEKQRIPPSCRAFLTAESAELFRRGKYYEALETVVNSRAVSGTATPMSPFIPKVSPSEGVDITEHVVTYREEMLKQLDSTDMAAVDADVIGAWKKTVDTAPPSIRALLPEDPPQEFWVEEYYSAIQRAVLVKVPAAGGAAAASAAGFPVRVPAQGATSDKVMVMADMDGGMGAGGGAAAGARAAGAGIAGMDALLSGAGFAEAAVPTRAETGPLEFLGSAKIFAEACAGTRWVYEGVLLESDEDIRPVPVRDAGRSPGKRKASGSSGEVVALDVKFADKTGPVNFTLWEETAREMLALIPGAGRRVFRLENMRVATLPQNDWNGTVLTTLKVVHSVSRAPNREGTIVRLAATPTSPFMLTGVFRTPGADVAISNFAGSRSRLVAPFRASFVGAILSVGPKDVTQTGQDKVAFELVDRQGAWMKCLAVGRNAASVSLVDGTHVVLYNCSGRPGKGSLEPLLMVGKEAVIVPTGAAGMAHKRAQVEFPSK